MKILLEEALDRHFNLVHYQERLLKHSGIPAIDAKSLHDYLGRDTGKLPQDKRLGIDLRLLQSYLQGSSWAVRWVSGPQQLADILTKEDADASYLRWVLGQAKYQLHRDKDLQQKVSTMIDHMQTRILDKALTKDEKNKERNRRKSLKHKSRLDTLREHMNSVPDAPRPTYFADNIAYAIVSALEKLRP